MCHRAALTTSLSIHISATSFAISGDILCAGKHWVSEVIREFGGNELIRKSVQALCSSFRPIDHRSSFDRLPLPPISRHLLPPPSSLPIFELSQMLFLPSLTRETWLLAEFGRFLPQLYLIYSIRIWLTRLLLARIDPAIFTFPYQRKRSRRGPAWFIVRFERQSYLLKSLPIFTTPLIINVCKILVIASLIFCPAERRDL